MHRLLQIALALTLLFCLVSSTKLSRSHQSIAVANDAISSYVELRWGPAPAYIIYKIEDYETIVVESSAQDYKQFTTMLPLNACRYAVVKVNWQDGIGKHNKVIFVEWKPRDATLGDKKNYSMNRKTLADKLVGVHLHIQAEDRKELSLEKLVEKAKNI